MRVIKNLFGFVLMVGLLLVLVGFFLPARVNKSMETVVGASSESVYQHLSMTSTLEDPENALGNSPMTILTSSLNDSVHAVSTVGSDYKAYITYKLSPVNDSVRLKGTMSVELGMNPISRYYGLVLDAKFASLIERNLKHVKTNIESRPKKG